MSNKNWHPEILPPEQTALLPTLAQIPDHFVLYGGTALALHLGHRESIDFDFFSAHSFVPDRLEAKLPFGGTPLQKEENTLTLLTDDGVKISFFGGLSFAQIAPVEQFETIRVASILDLFATKLNTIYQRAEAKDYQDIGALLKSGYTLEEGMGAALAVFGDRFNSILPLKALAWYGEPGLDSLPSTLKESLTQAARDFEEPQQVVAIESKIS